jgi:hypothetical protein
MDGTIHTATACQLAVRGVDNSVSLLSGDVALHQFDATGSEFHDHEIPRFSAETLRHGFDLINSTHRREAVAI